MLSTSIRKKATMQTAFPVDRAQVRLHKKNLWEKFRKRESITSLLGDLKYMAKQEWKNDFKNT